MFFCEKNLKFVLLTIYLKKHEDYWVKQTKDACEKKFVFNSVGVLLIISIFPLLFEVECLLLLLNLKLLFLFRMV